MPNSVVNDVLARPLPVHRLDARVAGCVVVAKSRHALVHLKAQFEDREVVKEYRAILVGDLLEKCAAEDAHSLVRWESGPDVAAEIKAGDAAGGSGIAASDPALSSAISPSAASVGNFLSKTGSVRIPVDRHEAHTDIRVLDIIPCPQYGAITSVSLSPHTGRRHQLRRHCAALGCPIVGDDLYHEAAFKPPGQSRLQAIQAASAQQQKQKQKHKPQPSSAASPASDVVMRPLPVSHAESGPLPSCKKIAGDAKRQCRSTTPCESPSPELVSAHVPRVRKGSGLYLMCSAIEFNRPTEQTETDVPQEEQQRLRAECPESPRFERLRTKARRGSAWKASEGPQE